MTTISNGLSFGGPVFFKAFYQWVEIFESLEDISLPQQIHIHFKRSSIKRGSEGCLPRALHVFLTWLRLGVCGASLPVLRPLQSCNLIACASSKYQKIRQTHTSLKQFNTRIVYCNHAHQLPNLCRGIEDWFMPTNLYYFFDRSKLEVSGKLGNPFVLFIFVCLGDGYAW
jgi:hypothetical protein